MIRFSHGGIRRVLMITSEAVPYAKTGGLADAVAALSDALCARGHDIRVVLPRYYFTDKRDLYLSISDLEVDFAGEIRTAAVYETRLGKHDVPCFFVDHEELFGRDGIYGTRAGDYKDNHKRFAFLAEAAVCLCRRLAWQPHVLHSHDWPAALVPMVARQEGFLVETKTVLTVHNLAFQGVYPASVVEECGLSWELFLRPGVSHGGMFSFLRAGLVYADGVATVSPNYAAEILTPEFGCGLDSLLRRRSASLRGILNGADYREWNPETDVRIFQTYGVDSLEKKAVNKSMLRNILGLSNDPAVPLFVYVSRLTHQKGIEELFHPAFGCVEGLLSRLSMQLAVLGVGERWCEQELSKLAARHESLSVTVAFDETLAHRFYAAADFLLMPSVFEPCGLNQLYALRYGTIPVVTPTGGLVDTVVPYDRDEATGFVAPDRTSRGIDTAVRAACEAYDKSTGTIEAMRRRGMQQRFSWDVAAKEYEALYAEIGDRPSSPPTGPTASPVVASRSEAQRK